MINFQEKQEKSQKVLDYQYSSSIIDFNNYPFLLCCLP